MPEQTPTRRGRGRPPKRIDERLETREALIRRGTEVLTEKGFSATGLDEVLRQIGVPKGSFYHYFDSKEAFGLEVVDHYAAYFALKLDRWFDDESRAPRARLAGFIEAAKEGMARHAYRRGCLIGNLGQEMSALPESYRDRLEAVFQDWQARLAACLEVARRCGEIAPDADCERLAAFFWIGWEGAVLRARLMRSAAPLDLFAQEFVSVIKR